MLFLFGPRESRSQRCGRGMASGADERSFFDSLAERNPFYEWPLGTRPGYALAVRGYGMPC